jgi:glycerol-3-phosphate acyltransferase PlsY
MNDALSIFGLCIFAYLFGSLPFALWVTKWLKGVDVRDAGSGHISTTNTIRQVGWFPGIIVLILDMGKGFLPTIIAYEFCPFDWLVPIIAALTVVGHCWPVFAQFKGGMGLATAGGCALAVFPFGIILGLVILIPLMLLIKHAARASLITSLLLAPEFYLFGERGITIGLAACVGVVLAVRFISDWNREYKELWLDRDTTR